MLPVLSPEGLFLKCHYYQRTIPHFLPTYFFPVLFQFFLNRRNLLPGQQDLFYKHFLLHSKIVFGFEPPRNHGYDTVEAIHAMHEGKAKIFFAMGGNFLSATPDTTYTAEALRKCNLTVQVSTKLNRSHLVHGDEAIILPCLGRSDRDVVNGEEQFVSTENSMGVIQRSKGNLTPVSNQLFSEPVIVCRLAKATLGNRNFFHTNPME